MLTTQAFSEHLTTLRCELRASSEEQVLPGCYPLHTHTQYLSVSSTLHEPDTGGEDAVLIPRYSDAIRLVDNGSSNLRFELSFRLKHLDTPRISQMPLDVMSPTRGERCSR